jgi:circadian clock protein KaiC
MWLQYETTSQRVSSGNPFLDEILGGGYRKGTCMLISGATGTGKTSVASTFARSASAMGEKVLYINFEESPDSMVSGMLGLGIDLRPIIQDASLWIKSAMPESKGIEEHLYDKIKAIERFQPQHVVVDAISACQRIAGENASFDFIMRLIHFCKKNGITMLVINQTRNAREDHELSGIGISSIIDTIVTLQYQDVADETRRFLHVIKSRGAKHSHRYHQFFLTDSGIQFAPPQSDPKRPTTA